MECYDETGELKLTAEEFGMSALKIRKLLITAGEFGKSSVNGYLPYTKTVYKPEELSPNAERINMFRSWQQAVRRLATDMSEEKLWDAVVAFQKYPFHTATELSFVYELKKGRDGKYNKELIVSRRTESKSVV